MPVTLSARALTATGIAFAVAVPVAHAADRDLVRAHRTLYPAAESAAAGASGSEGVQRAYDAVRDLQEAVRAAAPVSAACRPLRDALARYSAGRVLQYEGIDRPSPGDTATGVRRARAARSAVAAAAGGCPGTNGGRRVHQLALSPVSGEAFYGPVVARAPGGADAAELTVDGGPPLSVRVAGGRARFTVGGPPRRVDLRVAFTDHGRPAGASRARGAWLLGPASRRAVTGVRASAPLAAALARATASGPRYRAAWVQDLASGAAAGANASSLFPAASTVKLGPMAAALARLGARPEDSPYAADLRAMAGWSSNLATNRILRRLGGTALAADGLRRLGAVQSTFPGEYLVGTQLQAPPRVSQRVTSARDLGRMLASLQAAAVGAPGARVRTGMTGHQARLMLGWLLSSQRRGDNASLLAGGAPGLPIAQKNGWIHDARLGAGIVFTPRGPVVAVVATYDDAGVRLGPAQALGARVARVAVATMETPGISSPFGRS